MSWKIKEENYLLDNWKIEPLAQIIEFLDKTEDSIMRKAGRMGLDIHKEQKYILKKKWTIDEDQYMLDNYNSSSIDTFLKDLNRSRQSIFKRAQYLKLTVKSTRWTENEINYLEENWGLITIKNISKKLRRTTNAVSLKACKLSLREQVLGNGSFFTPKYISEILNISIGTIYNCIANGQLYVRKFYVGRKFKYQISVDSFLDFLENNCTLWDSKIADIKIIESYYSNYIIRKNDTFSVTILLPHWLKTKIRYDTTRILFNRHNLQWTMLEDNLLYDLKKRGCSLNTISIRLHRTSSSIKSRFYVICNNYSMREISNNSHIS